MLQHLCKFVWTFTNLLFAFPSSQIEMNVNNMDIKFPHQLFINNEFVDATGGDTYKTINPNDESVICELAKARVEDVDAAVEAAHVSGLATPFKLNTTPVENLLQVIHRWIVVFRWNSLTSNELLHLKSIHPLRKIWEKCTTGECKRQMYSTPIEMHT